MSQAAITPLTTPNPNRGPRTTFPIPAEVRQANDPTSVTMVQLTLQQDLDSNKTVERTGNSWEKVKLCIVAVDGKPVDWIGGQVDTVLERTSPLVRELIMHAWMSLHIPQPSLVKDFLAKAKTEL